MGNKILANIALSNSINVLNFMFVYNANCFGGKGLQIDELVICWKFYILRYEFEDWASFFMSISTIQPYVN